jgi:hypothetical protein
MEYLGRRADMDVEATNEISSYHWCSWIEALTPTNSHHSQAIDPNSPQRVVLQDLFLCSYRNAKWIPLTKIQLRLGHTELDIDTLVLEL